MVQNTSSIDIKSTCLVRMAAENHPPSVPQTLELTPWDLPLLPYDPIQKGILFHNPNHSQTPIDHLKDSLARTLVFFPPLSGRLRVVENDDKTISFLIDCNDAGAEFTHASASNMSVSDILEARYIPEIVSSFFPLNDYINHEGTFKPLLGVQVTELADGFFIGCSGNHTVMDGTSFWHFFNSWSEISRGFDTISKLPVFERGFPSNTSKENERIRLPPLDRIKQPIKLLPPSLLERVFKFDQGILAKLKAKANCEARSTKISTLQTLSAHLLRAVLRSRPCRGQSNDAEESYFYLAVGTRSRIPLPEGYFGTAAYPGRFSVTEQEVLDNGLGFTAQKINEFVAKQTRESLIKFVDDWLKSPEINTRLPVNFIVTSSPWHDVYGCDFGWGKPVGVRSGKGQKFDGKMTVFPAAEGGGIDVEVCLAAETLKSMESDEEFMETVTV